MADLTEAMYHAIASDNPTKVQHLINQGANVDEVYYDITCRGPICAESVLHVACKKSRMDCTKLLVENGAMVSMRDRWGQTPLMYCILNQDIDIARLLLIKHPKHVNDQERSGKTALHVAADYGHLPSVQLLLEHGADVNKHTNTGTTPLMTLCGNTDVEEPGQVIEMLLKAGALLEMADLKEKRTALQLAVMSKNVRAVEALLQAGADLNTTDTSGRTPLTNVLNAKYVHIAEGTAYVDPDVMTIIVLLAQSGADLNMSSSEFSSPLISSVHLGAEVLVRYFMDNGADPNTTFPSGISPLLIAASKNDLPSVKTLLYRNCDLYRQGRYFTRAKEYMPNFDAFQIAIVSGSFEMAECLLHAGYKRQDGDIVRNLLEGSLMDNEHAWKTLQEIATNPLSLLLSTIVSVRKLLGSGVQSEAKAEKLPLPRRLVDLVLMKSLLC